MVQFSIKKILKFYDLFEKTMLLKFYVQDFQFEVLQWDEKRKSLRSKFEKKKPFFKHPAVYVNVQWIGNNTHMQPHTLH